MQSDAFPGMSDLARGARGAFRYVFAWHSPNEKRKITEVMLLRSKDAIDRPPAGWDRMTGDINWKRRGEFLYLIYKTKAT